MIRAILALTRVGCWAEHVAAKCNVAINVRSCRPDSNGRSVQNWVEILADRGRIDKISDQIRSQVIRSEIVQLKEGKAFGLVTSERCAAAEATRDLKCAIMSHRVERDGSVELEVLASGKNTVNQLIHRLLSRGIQVKVLELRQGVGGTRVTARQEEVVRKALEMGYYDYPRKIRQKDLAKACGVSSSTLTELLRRAEHNIIGAHTGSQGLL